MEGFKNGNMIEIEILKLLIRRRIDEHLLNSEYLEADTLRELHKEILFYDHFTFEIDSIKNLLKSKDQSTTQQ